MANTRAPSTIVTIVLSGQTEFTIPFEYLARKYVEVTLLGIDRLPLVLNTDFRFVNKTLISLTKPYTAEYKQIELRRVTSATERLVDFHDGSILRAYDLNLSQIQTLHVAEEARDLTADTIGVNDEGHLDARGRRLVNLADAVNGNDAVSLGQVIQWNDSAYSSMVRAEAAADIATHQANVSGAQATISLNKAAESATSAATATHQASVSGAQATISLNKAAESEASAVRSEAAASRAESAAAPATGIYNRLDSVEQQAADATSRVAVLDVKVTTNMQNISSLEAATNTSLSSLFNKDSIIEDAIGLHRRLNADIVLKVTSGWTMSNAESHVLETPQGLVIRAMFRRVAGQSGSTLAQFDASIYSYKGYSPAMALIGNSHTFAFVQSANAFSIEVSHPQQQDIQYVAAVLTLERNV